MESETYYDEVIAPQLAAIALDCKARGMSVVFAVEYAPDGIGETRLFTDSASADIKSVSAHLARLTRPLFAAFTISQQG